MKFLIEIYKKLKKKIKLKIFLINNKYKKSKKKYGNNKYINKNEIVEKKK